MDKYKLMWVSMYICFEAKTFIFIDSTFFVEVFKCVNTYFTINGYDLYFFQKNYFHFLITTSLTFYFKKNAFYKAKN